MTQQVALSAPAAEAPPKYPGISASCSSSWTPSSSGTGVGTRTPTAARLLSILPATRAGRGPYRAAITQQPTDRHSAGPTHDDR